MVADSERVSPGWDKVEADVSEFDAEEAGRCAGVDGIIAGKEEVGGGLDRVQAVSRGMDTHREDSCLRDSWEAECISDPYTTHFIVNIETCDIPSTYIPLLSSLLRKSRCRNTNSYSRNRHTHACWRLLPRSLFGDRMSVRFLQLQNQGQT